MGACLPGQKPLPTPPADLNATAAVLAATLVAQTAGSSPQPATTLTSTFTPIASGTLTARTPSLPAGASLTSATVTHTAGTPPPASPTVTSGPITIDTLPANTPYGTIRLENRSKTGVSLSLHCTTLRGYRTILEYDVYRTTIIEAPLGDYVYVVYIGGHKFVGTFTYGQPSTLVVTFYRDKVVVH